LASELNADSLVQELKTEVEALDNRIYINDTRTNVIYVDKSNTLIFNIYWMNKYSKSYDQIAFGYDLSSAV
jgi:type IV secretory pathway VirB9-like protein